MTGHLSYSAPTGTKPATWACALTRKCTTTFRFRGGCSNQLSHTSQELPDLTAAIFIFFQNGHLTLAINAMKPLVPDTPALESLTHGHSPFICAHDCRRHWILFMKKGSSFPLKMNNIEACVYADEYKNTTERRPSLLEERRWIVTGQYRSR